MLLHNSLSKFIQFAILCIICVGFSTANQENYHLSKDDILSRGRRAAEATSYFYYQQAEYPRDCQEVYEQCSNTTDGVFLIKPDGYPEPFEVFCNNTIDGGGWTVFQRRQYGDVNFHRSWTDYKNGFGFIHRDFWLGNEKLSHLTNQKSYVIRMDLVSSSGDKRYVQYDIFRISDEGTKYKLQLGSYSGNAGNYFASGYQFSTYDQDNDPSTYHCATKHRGGWWYHYHYYYSYCYSWSTGSSNYRCSNTNLNGNFGETGPGSIYWYGLPGSYCNVRYAEMKIRPV